MGPIFRTASTPEILNKSRIMCQRGQGADTQAPPPAHHFVVSVQAPCLDRALLLPANHDRPVIASNKCHTGHGAGLWIAGCRIWRQVQLGCADHDALRAWGVERFASGSWDLCRSAPRHRVSNNHPGPFSGALVAKKDDVSKASAYLMIAPWPLRR